MNSETEVERLRRADEIVQSALECWGGEQSSLLDEACAGDELLRAEVESLLNYRERAKDFIETPAFAFGAEWLPDVDGTGDRATPAQAARFSWGPTRLKKRRRACSDGPPPQRLPV